MELPVPSSFFLMLIIFFHLIQLHKSVSASYDDKYLDCKKPLQCGHISITYPFYDGVHRPEYCGYPGFNISCDHNETEIFMTSSEKYIIVNTDQTSDTISVAREDNYQSPCPEDLSTININNTLFNYTSSSENVTLFYECSPDKGYSNAVQFDCPDNKNSPTGFFFPGGNPSGRCKSNISVPMKKSAVASIKDPVSLQAALDSGFDLKWNANNQLCEYCRGSKGECGYNPTTKSFICYCPDRPHLIKCPW